MNANGLTMPEEEAFTEATRRSCIVERPAQTINTARKSFTFVKVGPGTTRSPIGLKKL